MNSQEKWNLQVDPSVDRQLKKFPAHDSRTISVTILEMSHNPYVGDLQKMKGENSWRRRVGSYRVFFRVYQEFRAVVIYRVERRTSNTY